MYPALATLRTCEEWYNVYALSRTRPYRLVIVEFGTLGPEQVMGIRSASV
jgi:hypothetical protein